MTIKQILQGRFIRHPLHPILVHLPVGLWVAALIFDILSKVSSSRSYASASYYAIALGIVGAIPAAAAGLSEWVDIPRDSTARRIASTHMVLNFIVLGLFIANLVTRPEPMSTIYSVVTGSQLILTAISIFLLAISGYLGGALIYQYGVGLRPRKSSPRPHAQHESERRDRAA